MRRFMGTGFLLALGLASCSKPPVVAVAPPPPPPVGHIYTVMVDVPPPARKLWHWTPVKQEQVQQAFNVIALKSSLMVGALSCNQQTQYDQFMTEFQPHILSEQHVMDAYFKRIGGYQGQAEEDNFVTLLANNQSVSGIGQGGVFCLNNQAEFQQVEAFKTPADLDDFVTDKSPEQAAGQTAAIPAPQAMATTPSATADAAPLKKSKTLKMADAALN